MSCQEEGLTRVLSGGRTDTCPVMRKDWHVSRQDQGLARVEHSHIVCLDDILD